MSSKKNSTAIPKDHRVLREGFLEKRVGMLKLWKSRYFVLLEDLICYFLKEEQKESLLPTGRIFFSDIVNVDRIEKKGHPFSMIIQTNHKKHVMSCQSYEEREDWVNKLWEARESHKNKEQNDPIRRRSTRLGKDFKRITIKKDPKHGIGCTIKNVAGAIFVSRIIPDGPVATSGVLRPGDQIIDINGARVSECPIEKIKDIIRSSPEYIVCTVKPVTHYTSHEDSPQFVRSAYTEVDPEALQAGSDSDEETPYTQVEISAESMEDLCRNPSRKDESMEQRHGSGASGHGNYMNSEVIDDHEKLCKKQTNYVELEFGAR